MQSRYADKTDARDKDVKETIDTPKPTKTAPKSKARAKAAPKSKAKAKSAPKSAIDAPKHKGKAKAKKAVAVSDVKFPPIQRKDSLYWGGGRLYLAKGGTMVRVYARTWDRASPRFGYKDAAGLKVAWSNACKVISTDPRPVKKPIEGK